MVCYFMVLLGTSWFFMVFHGTSKYFIVLHNTSWYFMVRHGTSWYHLVPPNTSYPAPGLKCPQFRLPLVRLQRRPRPGPALSPKLGIPQVLSESLPSSCPDYWHPLDPVSRCEDICWIRTNNKNSGTGMLDPRAVLTRWPFNLSCLLLYFFSCVIIAFLLNNCLSFLWEL